MADKPTDIASVLLNSQDVIDAAVETVAATKKTQSVLEENIRVTDTKIGVHNVDTESHEDIRLQLGTVPSMVSEPEITGPTAVETGEENTWQLSAVGVFPSVKILSFEVTDQHGEVFTVEADDEGKGVFTHTFVGDRNQEISFSVIAKANFDFVSRATVYPLLITQHLPPVMTEMTHTFPAVISHGKTYNFSVSGIGDLDDDFSHYNILTDETRVTFSQKENLSQDTQYSLTVADDYRGPGTFTVTIEAVDDKGLTNTKSVSMRVNSDPVVTALTHNIPTFLNRNTTSSVRVSGITDPDGDTIKMAISSSIPEITFSKNSGIALNEDFVILIGNVAVDTPYTLTLTFTDQYGGTATSTISSRINTPPSMANFKVTQEEAHVVGGISKMTLSGATDVNGETVVYSIENDHEEITFSKMVNIAENEEIEVTISEAAERGKSYTVTVYAMDESGAQSTASFAIVINNLPDTETIGTTVLEFVIPGGTYQWSFSTETDEDGHTLSYTVTSPNPDVIITNGENLAAGDLFTCQVPTEDKLARGQDFELQVSISDGLESTAMNLTVTINSLPVSDEVVATTPTEMEGGDENSITFSMSGGTDPNNRPLTYTIVDSDPNLVFSKQSGIKANEVIEITALKVAVDTEAKFSILVVDTLGETSSPKEITILLKAIMVTAAPSILYPVNGNEAVPYYEGFTLTISAYQEVAWTGEGTYPNNHTGADMSAGIHDWKADPPYTMTPV